MTNTQPADSTINSYEPDPGWAADSASISQTRVVAHHTAADGHAVARRAATSSSRQTGGTAERAHGINHRGLLTARDGRTHGGLVCFKWGSSSEGSDLFADVCSSVNSAEGLIS